MVTDGSEAASPAWSGLSNNSSAHRVVAMRRNLFILLIIVVCALVLAHQVGIGRETLGGFLFGAADF